MVKSFFSIVYQACLQLIAPPFCPYCRSFFVSATIFCTRCSEYIQPVVSVQLPVVKNTSIWVHAITSYKEPIKQLILAKGSRNMLASRQLGDLVWQYTYISHLNFDAIVSIPLHWTRYITRGYNQADEIASVLALKSKKPIISCLKRVHKTEYQAALSAEHRKKNVRKAFSVTQPEHIEGQHILLVDDLMTTGATLQEAAKALLKYNPKKISVVVAARVV